jgi:hypothetical protein
MRPNVIALISPANSGKDFFYNRAKDIAIDYGYKYTIRISYADALKNELIEAFGPPCSLDQLNDRSTKEQWRPLMIQWSQTRKQQCGPDYWAKSFNTFWENELTDDTLVIITDMSFLTEKLELEERIPRGLIRYVRLRRIDDEYIETDADSSEAAWRRAHMPVDYTFLNPKTPEVMDNIVKCCLCGIPNNYQRVPNSYSNKM